jgi:hypothetical protein
LKFLNFIIAKKKKDLVIVTNVGIIMKELKELNLEPLFIIQNNLLFLFHRGVKIQVGG